MPRCLGIYLGPGTVNLADDDALPDHIGGHIRGSMNFRSSSLDATLATLVRKLEDKETVVFHCALSQQRGPGAALRYIRARNQLLEKSRKRAQKKTAEGDDESPVETAGAASANAGEHDHPPQAVYVLDRGFVGWQEVYGTDEHLTEGYVKELWELGY